MTESQECNYNPNTNALTLCPDMEFQLNEDHVGDVFQMAYIDGSPVIICKYNKGVIFFCPFCGHKLRDKPNYSENQWRNI